MAGQNGKCGVSGEYLVIGNMECHHKKPKELGGTDEYKNLMWVKTEVHKLIHATTTETIEKYMSLLKLDKSALKFGGAVPAAVLLVTSISRIMRDLHI